MWHHQQVQVGYQPDPPQHHRRAQTHLPSLLEKLSRIVSSAMEAEAISLEERFECCFYHQERIIPYYQELIKVKAVYASTASLFFTPFKWLQMKAPICMHLSMS